MSKEEEKVEKAKHGTAGTGNESDSSAQSKKINRFRKNIWIFQCITISGVLALCIAQLVTTYSFFAESKKINASVAMDIVQEMVQLQADIVLGIANNRKQKGVLYEFLKYGNYKREDVEKFLRKKANPFYIEVDTILNAQGEIAVSANDLRLGQKLDPNGIVTRLINSFNTGNLNDSYEYILEVAELSKTEFTDMNNPYFLTSEADAYGEAYSLRNQNSGLIILGCGSIIDDDGSLVGIKLLGYVLSGKYEIIEKSFKHLGKNSFAGIFHKNDSEWFTSQYIETAGLSQSRTTRAFEDFEILDSVLDSNSADYGTFEDRQGKRYTFAASPMFATKTKKHSEKNEVAGGTPSAVAVVGTLSQEIDSSLETTLVALVAFLIGTVLLILSFVVVTFRMFLDPMERLAKAVTKKDMAKVQLRLAEVGNSRNLIWAVIFAILAVSAVIAGMLSYNFKQVTSNFENQSSSYGRLQIMNLFYRRLTSQYFVETRGFGTSPNFIELVAGNKSAAIDKVQSSLDEFVGIYQLQMFMVIDSDKKIAASSTGTAVRGVTFDPKGMVSEILTKGTGLRATVLLSNSEYEVLNPNTFGESEFLPKYTGKMVATRIVAGPIFAENNTTPSGVVLFGRIFNGNPVSMTVRSVESYGGCAGIYYINGDEDPTLIASAFKSDKVPTQFDTDLTSPDLLEVVKRSAEINGYASEPSVEVLDEDWEISADRLFPGSEYDVSGVEKLSRRFDDQIYVLRCTSRSRWSYLVRTMAAISFVTFFGNLVAASIVAFVTFKPIYEFNKRFEKQWKPKPRAPTGSGATAKPKAASREELKYAVPQSSMQTTSVQVTIERD